MYSFSLHHHYHQPPSSFLFLLHFGFISDLFVGLISMILVKIRRPLEFPFIKPVFTPEQL